MNMSQKIRAYWRLVFLIPVIACIVCIFDLARHPTDGDFLFAAGGVAFFAVHLFRFAIGGALILAEDSKTPLRMKIETPPPADPLELIPAAPPAPLVKMGDTTDPLYVSPHLQRFVQQWRDHESNAPWELQ